MSTTKTFNNIKSGKKHQIDATARGYYDFRTTVVPQPNKPLSYDMKVYDGLNYAVDLSKNSVRAGEINFDGTVLPYVENNTLAKTNYCFGNSGTNYDLPVYNKEYVNINKIGDFDIGDGIVSNFYRDHYLTVTLPNYSSGSVNSFEICMKVHTPTNNTSNGRILNSTDSYDNLALDLGITPGFNFCGDTIGFGSQFDADIDLWIKVQFDGTNLSLHHSLNGVDYTQDNSKSWSKNAVWFTSNTYSIGLRSYDFVDICFFNGTIDLNECYVKINDEIINLGDTTLFPKYDLTFNANGSASCIEGSSLVGIGGNVTIPNIKLNPTDKIKISYKYESGYNEIMKLGPLYLTATLVRNSGILPYLYYKTSESETSFSTYKQLGSSLVKDQWYNVEITMIDLNTLKVGFSIGENNKEYTYFDITDGYFTEGVYECTINGSSCNEINFSGLPGLTQLTESKTGIFQDYEDNGKAKTLNAFSSNNELVVLSPNENIADYTWLGTVNIPKHIINWGQLINWYNWTSQVNELGEWVETTVPANGYCVGIAYGNGKYVAITPYHPNGSKAKYIYSEDGINWTDGTTLEPKYWNSLKYLNDRFIATVDTDDILCYSEDGINWKYSSVPNQYWFDSAYGNGKYIAVGYKYYTNAATSKTYVYSEDGINWTQGTLPTELMLRTITFGNGKFVASSYNSDKFVYSEDGINWTQGTLPTTFSYPYIHYGNGKFIISEYSKTTYVYSEDGINWTSNTLSIANVEHLGSMTFGDGIFIAFDKNNSKYIYSKDGINWISKDSSLTYDYSPYICYGNGKFVSIDGTLKSTKAAYIPVTSQELSVYTSKEKPTIDSLVYSNPNVESELTITNVGENNITLSDNNVYVRNPSGDTSTSEPSEPDEPSNEDVDYPLEAVALNDTVANYNVGDTIYVNEGMATSNYAYTAYAPEENNKNDFTIVGTITSKKEENGLTILSFDQTSGPTKQEVTITIDEDNANVEYSNGWVKTVNVIASEDDANISTSTQMTQSTNTYNTINYVTYNLNVEPAINNKEITLVIGGQKVEYDSLPVTVKKGTYAYYRINKSGYKEVYKVFHINNYSGQSISLEANN